MTLSAHAPAAKAATLDLAGTNWRAVARLFAIYTGLLAVTAVFLFPLFWIVGLSFKTRAQIFTEPPLWLWTPTLENYRNVLQIGTQGLITAQASSTEDFALYFINTVIVSAGSVLLALLVGVPAAYAFARFRFLGASQLFFSFLLFRMLPPIAVLVPMYVLMRAAGMLNTHLGLILAYSTFSLPLVVWVMRGFFEDLPRELEECAELDGCSRFATFWRIILPLSRPGLVAATIFSLVLAWNDFVFAAVLASKRTQTLPVFMAGFTTDVGIAWGEMAASAVLVILPVIVFSILAQRHLVAGLSSGTVKG
jgi:multiple sugar transport system permease protein